MIFLIQSAWLKIDNFLAYGQAQRYAGQKKEIGTRNCYIVVLSLQAII